MEKLINSMKVAFASEYSFYLKAHNYHWNVTGINFPQYHQLFDMIYTEVYENIDDFAENIRKLQSFVPGSFEKFSLLSKIQDETEIPNAEQMLQTLLDDSQKMIKLLKICFDLATENREEGLADFLAGRMDAHQKHSWMMRATLGQ